MKTNRKEIIKNYLHTWKPKGVFAIKNKKNGKIFVDGSMDIQGSQNRIFFELKLGSSYRRSLQSDYKLFGQEAFEFIVIEEIKQKEDPAHDYTYELEEMLKKHLNILRPYDDKGYNNKMTKE